MRALLAAAALAALLLPALPAEAQAPPVAGGSCHVDVKARKWENEVYFAPVGGTLDARFRLHMTNTQYRNMTWAVHLERPDGSFNASLAVPGPSEVNATDGFFLPVRVTLPANITAGDWWMHMTWWGEGRLCDHRWQDAAVGGTAKPASLRVGAGSPGPWEALVVVAVGAAAALAGRQRLL